MITTQTALQVVDICVLVPLALLCAFAITVAWKSLKDIAHDISNIFTDKD